MLNRRSFTHLLGATLAMPAHAAGGTLPFYSSVGPELSWYGLDEDSAELKRLGSVRLPANVQYAWPDPAGLRFLYVAASSNRPDGPNDHCVQAFHLGAGGALTPHGARVALRQRPVHITVDAACRFLVTAYNLPSAISVHRIHGDGTIGEEIAQPALDTGIYGHQVRFTPSGRSVVLVTRGNDARPGVPEDPGALKVFGWNDGKLSNLQSLAPKGNGLGFGARHVDFSKQYCFVSVERQNAICVYGLESGGRLSAEPLFIKNALLDPDSKSKHPGQGAGPIHVHPGGRFVYQSNRGSGTVEYNGQRVSNGGENNIVVWRINPTSGEPTRIQNIDSHGFEIRTFAITPDGKLLVAASQTAMDVREGDAIRRVGAGLSLYRIGADGKLNFVRKQDVDTSAGTQFWSGLLTMA
jgi:6-phosphogluconolactonase (cycloisomerase 2 family)